MKRKTFFDSRDKYLSFVNSTNEKSKIAFYLSIPALSGASVLGIKDLFEESIKFDFVFIFATFLSFIFSVFF